MTMEMQKKLQILDAFGFARGEEVMNTVLDKYPKNQVDKYRTKCFMHDEDRIKAHMR